MKLSSDAGGSEGEVRMTLAAPPGGWAARSPRTATKRRVWAARPAASLFAQRHPRALSTTDHPAQEQRRGTLQKAESRSGMVEVWSNSVMVQRAESSSGMVEVWSNSVMVQRS